jgi:acyl carrier protein
MSTIEAIKSILQDNLDIDPESINESTTFDSLNIDSLDMVELICELEDRLNLELGEPEGIKTVGEFVEYIENL